MSSTKPCPQRLILIRNYFGLGEVSYNNITVRRLYSVCCGQVKNIPCTDDSFYNINLECLWRYNGPIRGRIVQVMCEMHRVQRGLRCCVKWCLHPTGRDRRLGLRSLPRYNLSTHECRLRSNHNFPRRKVWCLLAQPSRRLWLGNGTGMFPHTSFPHISPWFALLKIFGMNSKLCQGRLLRRPMVFNNEPEAIIRQCFLLVFTQFVFLRQL